MKESFAEKHNRMKKVQSLRNQMLEARKKSMRLFSDISHRLETVATKNGVEWINDSKATDLDSTYYSLDLMEKPVIWIAGSSDVELDYSVLDKLVKYKVKRIICFGRYETNLKYSFANMVDGYAHKSTLEEAVATAVEWSSNDDVVLFSPASSSFNLYDNYQFRGEHFRHLVEQL
jgi:UDP-N-acetylmuramoylalanine--D-glutamate ligase